nr:MAG TPA: major capsid protein [Caudoviricetes sp.]
MSRPFSVEACDFSGWATRNDLKCSDGRVIRRDAFKNNDGIKVPLVWNHQHNSPRDVLGHAWLENREEGVYTYGFLNDTADGEIAKVLIKHGDICALSIYANQLQQAGPDVLHGCICEVSLVHKGANPGAFIDSMLKHGEMSDDEAIIYTGMPLCLSHSAESKDEQKEEEKKENTKEDKPAESNEEKKDDEETVADVIDSMSEKQQNVMYALIAQALEGEPEKESKDDSDNKSESNKEDNTMKHNVFDNDQQKKTEVLSHADQASIISMAKSNSVGSLRTAMDIYVEQNPDSVLAHGIDGIETLFPEYKDVRPGAPELLTTDQGWVNEVLKKVHKSPISRIRTRQADLRNIEALRAKGYKKGTQKGYVGNIQLLHRTTDPQTVYVKSNRTSVTPKKRDYLFGYDLVKATSSPTGRVTYPSDVDNAAFTPAAMNFSTGKFNYGGWAFDPGEKFMPRPCMLTYAGVVDHYLNPNDYTKKVNGTTSKVTDTSFGGNAMMEWPKIYTKRWESNGVYHFRCSDTPQDDTWDCWCNYDRNNNQIDHFYTPIYFGSLVSGKLRSISGSANSVNTTAANEIAYAKANGNDWYTEVLADRLLLQDLLVMMARSTECQTAFGYGRCNSSNSIAPGTMNSKGMFWGSNDKTSGVKVFGMENVWGNLWRRTAGWINANGTQKVKLTRGTHDGSIATDYNTDGNGYKTIANATPAGSSGGYISSMKTEAFGRLPVNASGSSSTYEADGMWYNNSQVNYAFVGGSWDSALLVGPFSALLNAAASRSGSYSGAALSCKPLAAA